MSDQNIEKQQKTWPAYNWKPFEETWAYKAYQFFEGKVYVNTPNGKRWLTFVEEQAE